LVAPVFRWFPYKCGFIATAKKQRTPEFSKIAKKDSWRQNRNLGVLGALAVHQMMELCHQHCIENLWLWIIRK
jgi:hypothetical protein